MKIRKLRKALILAAVFALILALGMTAYAAGWLPTTFHKMKNLLPLPAAGDSRHTDAELQVEVDALQAALLEAEQHLRQAPQQPETVPLPDFDDSSVTLSEQYYNGEQLLLGVDLSEVVPAPAVGCEPDDNLLGQIDAVAFFWDVNGDDDLDHLLSEGMEQEIYEDYLEHRSAYAKEFDLRHLSAIEFDRHLMNTLTPEAYEEAWHILRDTGRLFVAESSVSIGDHIVLEDGTELGPAGQQNLDSDGLDAHSGSIFIGFPELPESARNRDELNVVLTLKKGRTWYCMELGGPAYFHHETVGEAAVPFAIENVNR